METQGQANIFKRVFLFDLFVDGLSDGVALLLRPLLALRLVLGAAHTVLHGLALLPAKDKDIMRQQLFSASCCHPFEEVAGLFKLLLHLRNRSFR